MKRADEPNDDQKREFALALADVKRLPPSDRLPAVATTPPLAMPRQQALDDMAVLVEMLQEPLHPEDFESGDTLLYRRDGLPDSTWKKLRRGQYRLQAECDLHGLNRTQAAQEVVRFLLACNAENLRCVRIIHGKGNGSPNTGPVIKRALDSWLRKRQEVLAFCSARAHDGGTGAVYVLLKAR